MTTSWSWSTRTAIDSASSISRRGHETKALRFGPGEKLPIVHVNADDPEAALAAVRLALAYRRRFGHDVVGRPGNRPPA
jgi:hypothetical protein